MAENQQMKPNLSYFHVIVSAIIVAYSWILSFTILSPLFLSLKFLPAWRNKFFSQIFSIIFRRTYLSFQPLRKKLFEHFPVDSTKCLKVLEIGVGPGANFALYPSNCELTLLDMNENFDVNIRKELKNYPNLKVEKTVYAMAENMQGIPDSSYDVVVSTHLLCSVQDVTAVLNEVSRVLKPDGKYLYLDHIAFPVTTIPCWIQILMNPLWKVYFNGCNINRQPQDLISKVFSHNVYTFTYPQFLLLFLRPHVFGVASHSRFDHKYPFYLTIEKWKKISLLQASLRPLILEGRFIDRPAHDTRKIMNSYIKEEEEQS